MYSRLLDAVYVVILLFQKLRRFQFASLPQLKCVMKIPCTIKLLNKFLVGGKRSCITNDATSSGDHLDFWSPPSRRYDLILLKRSKWLESHWITHGSPV